MQHYIINVHSEWKQAWNECIIALVEMEHIHQKGNYCSVPFIMVSAHLHVYMSDPAKSKSLGWCNYLSMLLFAMMESNHLDDCPKCTAAICGLEPCTITLTSWNTVSVLSHFFQPMFEYQFLCAVSAFVESVPTHVYHHKNSLTYRALLG